MAGRGRGGRRAKQRMAIAQEDNRIKGTLRLPLLDLRSGNDAKVAGVKNEHGACRSPLKERQACRSLIWGAAALCPLFATATSAALLLIHVGERQS
jgi:hypothetical protein